ncbi:MAG: ABC transporter permease [Clostridia bacterium]|nr:ABC transporter permease [Clostridia bacterium]
MKKHNAKLADLIPFIAFVVIFAFFSIASGGKMFSKYNLMAILDQSMITIIIGCGVLFVVAQGSTDMTVGVNLGLSGVLATHLAIAANVPWLLMPLACIFGAIVGIFNGFLVAKCKVPSFMLSIAELIGVRGLINYIQTVIGAEYLPQTLRVLSENYVKIPMFIVIVAIMIYLFEFTKVGRYCRAIGENETTAKFIGIPVDKMKIVAFGLSGLTAGYASILAVAQILGTNMQMGVFLEMKVVMAIFFGGVLVTGGSSAKIYKVFLGALSITIIINGLALIGKSGTQVSQSVEGCLLILVMFITILANYKKVKASDDDSCECQQKLEEAKTE